MKKSISAIAVAVACALVTPVAFAGEGQGFVGVEVGQANIKFDSDSTNYKDTSYAVRGGYMFNRNVGIEGFYGRYYDKTSHFNEVVYPVGYPPVNVSVSMKPTLDAYGVGVVGKVNFSGVAKETGFVGKGRLGIMQANTKVSATATAGSYTNSVSESAHSTNAYVGVGVGYDFSRNMSLSLNYDYFQPKFKDTNGNTGNAKVNNWSLGFEYRF